MKRAAIDIGTNSIRLLIADVGEELKRIEKRTTITRLGKGVDSRGLLNCDAILNSIDVLMQYKKAAYDYGIDEINAIATSAVRDAANRQEFIDLVKEKTGISIEVISGEKEAELGFAGASLAVCGRKCTVIDIGGGSTELISGADGSISVSASINAGAVRVTEKFFHSGILDSHSILNACEFIRGLTGGIIETIRALGNREIVGIGGTATTLAAIDMKLSTYDPDKVHKYVLTKDRIDDMFYMLSGMSVEERKKIPGLQPKRADIIPAGALILKTILEDMGSDKITISESDNLEGLLLHPIS